jgi:hypothetical protein
MQGQAMKFGRRDFVKIFLQLHEVDIGLKSGGRQSALLEQLVYQICLK